MKKTPSRLRKKDRRLLLRADIQPFAIKNYKGAYAILLPRMNALPGEPPANAQINSAQEDTRALQQRRIRSLKMKRAVTREKSNKVINYDSGLSVQLRRPIERRGEAESNPTLSYKCPQFRSRPDLHASRSCLSNSHTHASAHTILYRGSIKLQGARPKPRGALP